MSTDIGAEYSDVRPLDESQMYKLTMNGLQLADHINSNDEFIDELSAVGCITWPQRQHIISLVQQRYRNCKLMDFLTRRSVTHLNKFIGVLSKDHPHLLPFLVTDGGEAYNVPIEKYQHAWCLVSN